VKVTVVLYFGQILACWRIADIQIFQLVFWLVLS